MVLTKKTKEQEFAEKLIVRRRKGKIEFGFRADKDFLNELKSLKKGQKPSCYGYLNLHLPYKCPFCPFAKKCFSEPNQKLYKENGKVVSERNPLLTKLR